MSENKPARKTPSRKTPPAEPTTLPELEEAVRARLHQHGQHGAVALFNKYTAAVHAKLANVEKAAPKSKVQAVKIAPSSVADSTEPIDDSASKPKAKPAKAKKAK